ncbi:peptide ligase PGM1-related protein [Streptomyces sp. B8F3]|uniref:preATP grasp domain-containing protein n=1 Tax=Streptomyces sp. B8F3 TaxID=3153573 RepID=UPI00325C5692
MAKILIPNVENASTWGVSRHLWMLNEGDIVISPTPIDPVQLEYVCSTLGFDAGTVSVLPGNQRLTDEYDEHLATQFTTLSDRLTKLLDRSSSWDIVPCQHTVGVAELAEQIGFPLDNALRFAAQRGPEILNRKSHFRQLAVGAEVPIADGSVVVSATGLAKALKRHLPKTGTVIVKRDNGKAGRDNITVTTGPATALPGSRDTRQTDSDLQATATSLWHELTDDRSRTLVVEAYHEASRSFWFEFHIDDQGRPDLRNSGTFRRRPDTDPTKPAMVWVGLDLPAQLPTFSSANAMSLMTRIVDLCAQVGYRGYVNVDGILTPDEGILINEVNGRWGGGLVVDVIGRRLVGENYADERVMSTSTDIQTLPLSDALGILDTSGIGYTAESREGIIIISSDAHVMESVAIAPDRHRAREIEDKFRKAVEKGTQ